MRLKGLRRRVKSWQGQRLGGPRGVTDLLARLLEESKQEMGALVIREGAVGKWRLWRSSSY